MKVLCDVVWLCAFAIQMSRIVVGEDDLTDACTMVPPLRTRLIRIVPLSSEAHTSVFCSVVVGERSDTVAYP